MPRKKRANSSSSNNHTESKKRELPRLEEKLIENLIELQRVNTVMVEKFEKLSNNISDLLGLFEMTARTFAANPVNQTSEKDKEFLEKIDKLLEQNKTIAKGLILMEDRIRERMQGQRNPSQDQVQFVERPIVAPSPLQVETVPIGVPQNTQIQEEKPFNKNKNQENFEPSITNSPNRPLPKF